MRHYAGIIPEWTRTSSSAVYYYSVVKPLNFFRGSRGTRMCHQNQQLQVIGFENKVKNTFFYFSCSENSGMNYSELPCNKEDRVFGLWLQRPGTLHHKRKPRTVAQWEFCVAIG
jgi:hypothetical protein